MNRLLSFLIVASLTVIAASAFIEQSEDSEVADIASNEALALAEADPQAKRRKGKGAKKAKKAKKAKRDKKRKSNKGKGGKRTIKQAKCSNVRHTHQCGIDAVAVLKYEGSAIDNFITQKKRALNFMKIVAKKGGKKANFDNSSTSMLEALGGDANAPVCKMAASRMTRKSAAMALSNYGILKNCSANIEKNCATPAGTINETKLEECHEIKLALKTNNKKCCDAADAAAKCICFAESATLMATAKASGCSKIGKEANNAMKKQKKMCTMTFGECNTAEAAATGLINICLGGDHVTAAADASVAAGTTAAAAGTTMAAAKTTMAATATAAGR